MILQCFVHTVVYEEMEDDSLHPAFLLAAIPVKVEKSDGDSSISKHLPAAVNVVKEITSADKSNGSRRHRRKCKSTDSTEESLQQFVARRMRAKKENKERKTGLQLMITDYFKHTKPVVKTEKKDEPPEETSDVLQSNQYKFDHSAVPEDDDLEIVTVIAGGKDTAEQKAEPFICIISDDEEQQPVKVEPKVEPQLNDRPLVIMKSEPLPETPVEQSVKAEDAEEVVAEPISLEVELAREDNLEESEKVSEKENILMMQVENLAEGLEEMKSQM